MVTAAALLVTFVALAASVSVYAHPTQDWNTMALSNMAERGVSATYIGCFTDGSPRLLPAPVYSGPLNTPDYCTNLCALNGFMLAGVEYGSECWCGNSFTTFLTQSNACNVPCSGDTGSMCGGSWTISLYRAPTLSAVSLGCFADTPDRVMGSSHFESSTLTVAMCLRYCTAGGYVYAGLEYSSQCFCSNTMPTVTSSGCTSTCIGDRRASCGGSWAMNVYTAGGTGTTTTTTTSTSTSASETTSTSTSTTSAAPEPTIPGTSSNPIASNAPAVAVLGTPAIPSSSSTKVLYAHMMVGNTYTYTAADWDAEMSLAQTGGVDGFALNMGRDAWEPARIGDAYTVAAGKGGFKLFLSFDMTSMPCAGAADAQALAQLVVQHASSPAQATYAGKTLVSTFAGETCYFGQGSVQDGWLLFKNYIAGSGVNIYFIPTQFSPVSTFASATWFDAELNWNSGWPMGSGNLDTSSDTTYMSALGGKGYMAALSPCFFTYYGPSSYNKNWIYRSDNWLLATRFESILSMRTQFDLVEMVSWNDFGESHYMGSLAPAVDQPNSTGWTNGFPHTAWLSLLKYYATAWKTGAYPANTDALWLWSRAHPKDATPSSPTNARPNNYAATDDQLYVVATLASDATVTISSGANTATWNLPAGLSKLAIASAAGSITAKIVRAGATVKSYDSAGSFSYNLSPADYNFNYFVASA